MTPRFRVLATLCLLPSAALQGAETSPIERQPPGCTRDGTLVLTYHPGPDPLRFPLHMRLSHDEGKTWSEPALLADRPAKVGGWSVCHPTLTELADGTLIAIWAQIKSSPGELYGDIHSARIVLKK